MTTPRTGQEALFERAKNELASELGPAIGPWTLADAMERFKRTASEVARAENLRDGHPMRYFCGRYMNLRGEPYYRLQKQLKGAKPFELEEMKAVIRALAKHGREPSLHKKETARKSPPTPGLKRQLVYHSISTLSSLRSLLHEAGLRPEDVFDGDRMHVIGALNGICDALGIDAKFPEPDPAHDIPVTAKDLDLGIKQPRERRR